MLLPTIFNPISLSMDAEICVVVDADDRTCVVVVVVVVAVEPLLFVSLTFSANFKNTPTQFFVTSRSSSSDGGLKKEKHSSSLIRLKCCVLVSTRF